MASFAREALAGRNRSVSGIAIIAALAGLLFGFDTGVISVAQLFAHRRYGRLRLADVRLLTTED